MTTKTRATDWAQLVRLPNVFTILADVGAAYLLVARGPQPIGRLLIVLAAGVALYWAGMVLNDLWDLEQDRAERPQRPLPSGRIALSQARLAGWSLLLAGVVLAAISGVIPAEGLAVTWRPAAVALALVLAIVVYDGPAKRTPLGPPMMGLCRFFSFLLGASPLVADRLPATLFEPYLLAIAAGFGVYIMGVTGMARGEAKSQPQRTNLVVGFAVTLAGLALLAFAPRLAPAGKGWDVSPDGPFPLLIGVIALPVILRGVRVLVDPQPFRIQLLIRIAILTMIPLAAAFALLGAGPMWGFAVFFLVFPAILLSARFRVT